MSDRIEGTWKVGYAIYPDGAKPATEMTAASKSDSTAGAAESE